MSDADYVDPHFLWQEQMYVYTSWLYHGCDDSHWMDVTYDSHVAWLQDRPAKWTNYIRSRLPEGSTDLKTSGYALRWTAEDKENAIDWRDKCLAGKWYQKTLHAVDTGKPKVYATQQQESKPTQEVPKMPITTQEIVEKYVMLRDKKQAIVNDMKEQAAKYDAVLDKLEAHLLKQFEAEGVDSVKTKAGTAYKTIRTSVTVADWEATLDFIRTNEMWHLLERRASKVAVEAYREENDAYPPGLNVRTEAVVNVRRA